MYLEDDIQSVCAEWIKLASKGLLFSILQTLHFSELHNAGNIMGVYCKYDNTVNVISYDSNTW